ncbi:MAG: AAA family ATPase [Cyanothece sp. SIO2G6]|nr:AAA family ATPase [Cyanothece sp. SIO2G6]
MEPKYQILEKIYESANSLVYRAFLKKNHQPIILKILKENYPTFSELTRYKQEYEITCSLNVENIIKVYELQRYENSLVMFLEDFGGTSLKLLISQNQLCLEKFLIIAIKITESLANIHDANIIHKDINPANIVYNPQTEQLKIIDFGISTRLSQEFMTVLPPSQLEGTLAYIAPEQTGRMNRGIDYRSDFYSLGVTFYEILANKLPFETTDPIELVHCHIAQQPVPVDTLVPDIPLAVSNIVKKLLAKIPENRYQSARGIKADLESCLNQLKSQGKISPFPLGCQDVTEKFHLPQNLYGREQEVSQLLTAFDQISQGETRMVLISGYSGIGKSALVHEIHKPITRQRGEFISGKFDQFQRDIPYSAISQAFQGLIRKLLSEPKITLQTWKHKILEALEDNGQIIIDVIPELEKIINQQPPVDQLGRTESQNRFNLFFQRFLDVFCRKEHPLVIFIDDLQWADLPSLNLLEKLISDSNNKYFLIIGAYRDNEVISTHPLLYTLERINQAQVPIDKITLSPLNNKYINQLIADTLSCNTETSTPLAELIGQKTGGNPFFLTQLLKSLYQENLLKFRLDRSYLNSSPKQQGHWVWDIDQIKKVSITDNVVDLMTSKIEKLDQTTQKVIKLASCIGNQFNLEILSMVNNKSQILTARELQLALDEGLIIPLDNNYKIPLLYNQEELLDNHSKISSQHFTSIFYKFLHDRVQQAAYSLIPEKGKKQVHLQIGRLLLRKIQGDELQNEIFKIINQLNEGVSLITEQSEKNELAKLNLQAGKKAKASTAYEAALEYLEIGAELLTEQSWEYQYQLTLDLQIYLLECLYLNTQLERVEELSETILKRVKDDLDSVRVYELKIMSYFAQFQPDKAIDTAIKSLEKFGVKISQKNVSENSIKSTIEQEHKTLISILERGNKNIEDLADLPKLTEPYKIAAMSIMQPVLSAAWIINYPLLVEIILVQLKLCLQYNNPPQAAVTYGCYGMLLCGVLGDIDCGYEFGQLSIKLLEKYNIPNLEPLIIHLYYGFIWHWKKLVNDNIGQQNLLSIIQRLINTGNNEYACYCSMDYCHITFFRGHNLEQVEQDYEKYTKFIETINQEYSIHYLKICESIVENLIRKKQCSSLLMIGNSQDEENKYLEQYTHQKNQWLLFIYYFGKLIIHYIFKDYNNAFENSQNAKKYVAALFGFLSEPQYNFYSSLVCLSCFDSVEQTELIDQVKNNQERMKKWAKYCPETFQHKYDLVEAEKARALGNNWYASELYEKAVQGAKKYDFIHEEALACERMAEFYLALGREEIGKIYLKNSHHCYTRWGAKAKVKKLEEEYPYFFLGATGKSQSSNLITTLLTAGSKEALNLDLTTILKASQAISGEIKLENLLRNLMKIVIENAGAQQGSLILNTNEHWVVEAQGTVNNDDVTILQSLPTTLVDTETSVSILPTTVINYVACTQENIVLNNAVDEGQFISDPYIVAHKIKSILCTPLLNQGQLKGMVYLENNLTTGAFTTDRVELINILAAQAAISIDNSRLYQTLEQRVEERTKELSQTLDVLKATQAELILENDLLRDDRQPSTFNYQVGGSLPMDAPTYVVRSADRNLYKTLTQGEFCYILNARQMGKSSLMVRMMDHLQREGVNCAAIDMTRIGSENVTPEQWYKGLAVELWRSFGLLRTVNLKKWWNERLDISPIQRLGQFIEEVVLAEVGKEEVGKEEVDKEENQSPPPKVVLFIDEIDSVLGLDFPVSDFFRLIRSCYNQRTLTPDYQRLTFALFGVATPSELISDRRRTPFNIGQAIQLDGFKEHEAQPLLNGLTDKVTNPQVLLKEILHWTGGQPFLTQKVCEFIRQSSEPIPINQEAAWVETLVRKNIIENWEAQDDPEHLKTIRDRILKNEQYTTQLLTTYQQILTQPEVIAMDSAEERELILSGLVIKQGNLLKVRNPIYLEIFNLQWIEDALDLSGN